jgi:hypothetical protein
VPGAVPEGSLTTRVALEEGQRWTFASALDWPGWCRRGRDADAALAALRQAEPRYRVVAGPQLRSGPFEVVGVSPGDAGTDFGMPAVAGPWDEEPLDEQEVGRQVALLEAAWAAFDAVVARAPLALRLGPRGGGRDRDRIVDHVRDAERAYGPRLGVRVPPGTPWPEQRASIATTLRSRPEGTRWPLRYAIRRCAWHVLDHAWEIEDRTP